MTNSNAADNRVVKLSDISGNDNNTSGFALGSIGQAGDTRRYVGILNGTNVGAPLTLSANITGEWKGFLAMQTANFSSAKAIILDVGFDGTVGTIKTKAGGFAATVNGTSAPNITIDGKFGTNGVIYGTTSVTNVDTSSVAFGTGAIAGTLTGLIGEDGAVGVFSGANVHDVSFGYVGGFVAIPRPADLVPLLVNYADWAEATTITPLASGTATPPAESRFLTSTGNDLDSEDLPGTTTVTDLSTVGGDTTDGFLYRAINELFLVGISSTTDLGAPVDATTVLGTWNGKFVSVVFNSSVPASTTTDFTLAVTFGDTASGNAGSVASGTIGATGYAFTGEFDSRG
ncbi:MAG: hypothetical protein K8953_08965, partial [Proteobacteria bacterium]|nr:hypothetical protein [Pseudomonadota bacterium]